MAQKSGVTLELEGLERAWIARSIEVLKGTLIRSRAKEMPGSEIYELRSREISQLMALAEKVNRP